MCYITSQKKNVIVDQINNYSLCLYKQVQSRINESVKGLSQSRINCVVKLPFKVTEMLVALDFWKSSHPASALNVIATNTGSDQLWLCLAKS